MESAAPGALARPVLAAVADVAVSGHELVKRFGHGGTAVEALRGVSVAFERGSFTAIIVGAIIPARRGARIDVLAAIRYE
jgi:hypothetical protein